MHKTDLLGASVMCAFAAVTGQLPFDGDSLGDIVIKVCRDLPHPHQNFCQCEYLYVRPLVCARQSSRQTTSFSNGGRVLKRWRSACGIATAKGPATKIVCSLHSNLMSRSDPPSRSAHLGLHRAALQRAIIALRWYSGSLCSRRDSAFTTSSQWRAQEMLQKRHLLHSLLHRSRPFKGNLRRRSADSLRLENSQKTRSIRCHESFFSFSPAGDVAGVQTSTGSSSWIHGAKGETGFPERDGSLRGWARQTIACPPSDIEYLGHGDHYAVATDHQEATRAAIHALEHGGKCRRRSHRRCSQRIGGRESVCERSRRWRLCARLYAAR